MRYDVRWSAAGSTRWTRVDGVSALDVLASVSVGTILVRTRCVNSAGEGLCSASAAVTVD